MPARLKKLGLEIITDFPHSGNIKLKGRGYKYNKLAIRVPSWCDDYSFSRSALFENGYAVVDVSGDFEIDVTTL